MHTNITNKYFWKLSNDPSFTRHQLLFEIGNAVTIWVNVPFYVTRCLSEFQKCWAVTASDSLWLSCDAQERLAGVRVCATAICFNNTYVGFSVVKHRSHRSMQKQGKGKQKIDIFLDFHLPLTASETPYSTAPQYCKDNLKGAAAGL